MKEVSEKITERIRKLIRLKESATQIGSMEFMDLLNEPAK